MNVEAIIAQYEEEMTRLGHIMDGQGTLQDGAECVERLSKLEEQLAAIEEDDLR